jgi:hypothetical protein
MWQLVVRDANIRTEAIQDSTKRIRVEELDFGP